MSFTDVTDLVARAAEEVPERRAMVDTAGRGLTWQELEDQVAAIATALGEHGVLAGHRAMIVLGNRLEFVTTYLAVLRAQAVAVPVNPRSTPGELARMIADSGSRLVVADPESLDAVRAAVRVVSAALAGEESDLDTDLVARAVRPRVAVVDAQPHDDEVGFEDLRTDAVRPVPPLPDAEKLAVLLYTSGTSGRPRAAMLTHRALLANLAQMARVQPAVFTGDDVVLGALPLFHVYGLNAVLGNVLWHHARLVLVEHWDPISALDLIEEQGCSVLPVAPPVFHRWLAAPNLPERLGTVRLVLSGSAPLAPEVVEEFTRATGIPVHQGYGLTEAAPVVASTVCSTTLQARSVGAALPGIDIRLIDEMGALIEGEDPGEIEVRGDNLFSGYWPDGSDGPDAQGWWSTGDVGFLDAAGDLFLVDRVKELVIVSGFNVYPSEVEEVLREVLGVREAAVIGVADPGTGEAVVAYVVAPEADPVALTAAIREHAADRLAGFKRPTRIEVVDELPLTVTGKVQKGRLRALERRRSQGLLDG